MKYLITILLLLSTKLVFAQSSTEATNIVISKCQADYNSEKGLRDQSQERVDAHNANMDNIKQSCIDRWTNYVPIAQAADETIANEATPAPSPALDAQGTNKPLSFEYEPMQMHEHRVVYENGEYEDVGTISGPVKS